jgi:ABC-type multidrug transport system ATPase subunit
MSMTEILLNAELNLFALHTASLPVHFEESAKGKVAFFLRDNLGLDAIHPYLELYDLTLDMQRGSNPVAFPERCAAVASGLQPQLPRAEQIMLLAALLELVSLAETAPSENSLLRSVAEAFAVEPSFLDGYALFSGDRFPQEGEGLDDRFLLPSDSSPIGTVHALQYRMLCNPRFKGDFAVFRAEEQGPWFLRSLKASCSGENELFLDGVPLDGCIRRLKQGSVVSNRKRDRIHFGEIAAVFSGPSNSERIHILQGERLDYRYDNAPDTGLHDFTFSVRGGELVAVMGGSGSGKSTLLSLLTGTLRPRSGRLLLDGRDVTDGALIRQGLLGYVPQDDLLFEDLTVFENLYYGARLALPGLSDDELRRRCERQLDELNQLETANIKVGAPLDKTISGGQRKRLNIALELIREPAVLLVDEPTSGLSSADSVNVVSLLKAQAAAGRLVITVIHQPSSDVYKMFDRLWMLDTGGRPIYDGNPLDALVHFRSASYRAGEEEYACPRCGNVNPEQLFEIVEEKLVDDRGFPTKRRKVSPEDWHRLYLKGRAPFVPVQPVPSTETGKKETSPPSLGEQFAVFFLRTMKSRLANGSYRLSALLQPLLLALAAGLLFRGSWGSEYVFRNNANLPGYFFISTVIAVFLGMALSADEINRDRKILEREKLLRLSRGAYLASKWGWLILAAALQTGLYTVVGNALLEIPEMGIATWTILFSTAFCASMLGLNLSDSLASASTIHILIPVLLAPQIMLGGPTIPFDELVRRDAGHRNVPLIAEMMPTRWGYEALMVEHYSNNPFQRVFFRDETETKWIDFMTDLYIPEVRGLASYPFSPTLDIGKTPEDAERARERLRILRNELDYLERTTGLHWRKNGLNDASLILEDYSRSSQQGVVAWLKEVEAFLKSRKEEVAGRRSENERALRESLGHKGFAEFKNRSFNKEVEKLLLGFSAEDSIVISGPRLVPKILPIALQPESRFGKAHLFAPFKRIGEQEIATPLFNVGILWLLSATMGVVLQKRLITRTAALFRRFRRK